MLRTWGLDKKGSFNTTDNNVLLSRSTRKDGQVWQAEQFALPSSVKALRRLLSSSPACIDRRFSREI